jgi:hypothetical protein
MFHVKCDYRLMVDNLMDLTHEKYVHATSIGQQEIDETPCADHRRGRQCHHPARDERREGAAVLAGGDARNGLPDDQNGGPLAALPLRAAQPRADRRGRGAGRPGRLRAPAADKTSGIVVDLITPETETSIWYFWGLARNFRPDDKALTASDPRRRRARSSWKTWRCSSRQQRNLLARPERKLLIAEHRPRRRAGAAHHRSAGRAREGHVMSGATLSVRVARKAVEAEGICSFELVSGRRRAAAGVLGRLARRRAIAGRPDAPVLAVQRPGRDPPLPDRRAEGRRLARRLGAPCTNVVKEGDTLTISTPKNHFALAHEAAAAPAAGRRHRHHAAPVHGRAAGAHVGAAFEMHYCTRSRRARPSSNASRGRPSRRGCTSTSTTACAAQKLDIAALLATPRGRAARLRLRAEGLHGRGAGRRARRRAGPNRSCTTNSSVPRWGRRRRRCVRGRAV